MRTGETRYLSAAVFSRSFQPMDCMDDGVRVPTGQDLSHFRTLQTGSGAHATSYLMGTWEAVSPWVVKPDLLTSN
jgi:hypothetical protein